MLRIELAPAVECAALRSAGVMKSPLAAGNRSAIGVSLPGIDHRALCCDGRKAAVPILRAIRRKPAMIRQHDERRQILIQLTRAHSSPSSPRRESRAD